MVSSTALKPLALLAQKQLRAELLAATAASDAGGVVQAARANAPATPTKTLNMVMLP